ncbi:VOC family protein [Salinicoccus halitifaciens]|uniref:Catechol 2,3-dioxygenase n=1 Tax=Salinicoccus halitifaciens TaxID=1073415 RepID=A0ABV2EAW0_9STAP|nr:VOC family protein [Salinicoccus halitifaciens]MCD2137590.1 VOC family protein [Salinicoccus halitifaciens]
MENELKKFDIAELTHMELYTPDLEGTVWFFKDLLGLIETSREGKSVYLRGYEDTYTCSLKVTERDKPGLGHLSFRASSPEALERRVKALENSDYGKGWIDGDAGHGPAYQFVTPDNHLMEILWEIDEFEAPDKNKTILKNRPQKRPLHGYPVKRLDHAMLMSHDVAGNKELFMDLLGFKLSEHIVKDDGSDLGIWLRVTNTVNELVFTEDEAPNSEGLGRLNHFAFLYGSTQNLFEVAEVLKEHDLEIEAGPFKHGISQTTSLYVYEPGGNRVELYGDPGYLIFNPDWKPVKWTQEEVQDAIMFYGSPLPESFFINGTPNV